VHGGDARTVTARGGSNTRWPDQAALRRAACTCSPAFQCRVVARVTHWTLGPKSSRGAALPAVCAARGDPRGTALTHRAALGHECAGPVPTAHGAVALGQPVTVHADVGSVIFGPYGDLGCGTAASAEARGGPMATGTQPRSNRGNPSRCPPAAHTGNGRHGLSSPRHAGLWPVGACTPEKVRRESPSWS
jgi:hypothetical protein